MAVDRFVDEVSSESPAPGGGSVSALAGSLAAALAAMVANLTVGKKGYEDAWGELSDLAVRAQEVKDRLVRAVDEDTEAFNAVLEATRMPKGTPEEQAARDAGARGGLPACDRGAARHREGLPRGVEAGRVAAGRGNRNSASDAGVAALMARAGSRAASSTS